MNKSNELNCKRMKLSDSCSCFYFSFSQFQSNPIQSIYKNIKSHKQHLQTNETRDAMNEDSLLLNSSEAGYVFNTWWLVRRASENAEWKVRRVCNYLQCFDLILMTTFCCEMNSAHNLQTRKISSSLWNKNFNCLEQCEEKLCCVPSQQKESVSDQHIVQHLVRERQNTTT